MFTRNHDLATLPSRLHITPLMSLTESKVFSRKTAIRFLTNNFQFCPPREIYSSKMSLMQHCRLPKLLIINPRRQLDLIQLAWARAARQSFPTLHVFLSPFLG